MTARLILLFVALATGGFAIGTTEFATMGVLPLIEDGFAVGKAQAGYAISAYALGVVIGAPVITVLAARIARKTLLVGLMASFSLAHIASALAPTFGWLCFFRLISGLPHGAYFGLAALVAASSVPLHRQTQAVGYVMLGLTTATIAGVPVATWFANWLGWRAAYFLVAGIAAAAVVLVAIFVPYTGASSGAHPRRELGAFRRPDVWLTLAIGAIGFGGVFSVYAYLTSTLGEVTGLSETWRPLVLSVFGIGMTAGNVVIPRFADHARLPTAGITLAASGLMMGLFYFAATNVWAVTLDVFFIGFGTALATVLQTRLMDVAGDSQNLAASLNHVAFNLANAIGPFLAGLALAAGLGLRVTGVVGSCLTLGGLVFWFFAWRRSRLEPAKG
ncbi:MFS transporter [Salinisphaera sp. USBA-960]|uniref:MFS transporter n=1 Tax=Salinisphaera orenii TaxID=856731 RepID=UPI000DBEA239|nr:MFS transporter [Salifodinibacter halophilus]NNC25451.1 MFS transporter [Salifodinibacter halophilus]